MKWPALRVSQSSSKNFGMYEKARQLDSLECPLIHLELGRPDFDTPQHIKLGAITALENGIVHYSDLRGIPELRDALSNKLKSHNNINVSSEEVLMTNGLTQGAYTVFMAALDEGDEVILLEPYYPQHVNKIELAGGKVILAPLDAQHEYRIDRHVIESRITPKTRMICLVNPCNPTGRVYKQDELQIIADLAIENDLMVVSDEVYEQIVYDGHQHISIASLPGMQDRTFTLFAFTKAFAMDGWRLGYVVCSQKYMSALLKINSNCVTHVNVFIQHGALAAITGPQQCLDDMLQEDDRRRHLVFQRLNKIEGITCSLPEGTIYAFPDISALSTSSQELADEILKETQVVTESGAFYGAGGEGRLRICFGSEPYEVIEQAMDRLQHFFDHRARVK